jgi:hypothetical protein
MASAECRHTGPAVFFNAEDPSEAKAICAGCSVRAECLAYALATRQARGVWGGLTPRERRRPDPHAVEVTARRGPPRLIDDTRLAELLADADPDRPALAQLRARVTLSQAAAYAYLSRARELGLVERRGRGLYPARR